jgi:multiple sugar transport system permease protein
MRRFSTAAIHVFIIIMALITIFPFAYMLSGSFMSYQEATSIPPIMLPHTLRWSNFAEAMRQAPFARYFFNTILVSAVSTLGTIVTTVLASFALVRLKFRGKRILFDAMVALLMVPYEVVVFTNYRTIAQLELIDTYWALILPSLASVFYIFYLQQYLVAVPDTYYNAAKVDGCGDLEFIWKVMVPMSRPALFTMGLLLFIQGWNSFLWPILVTNSTDMRLIGNGLSAFATESGTAVQLQMAASAITIIPILVLYVIFHKQIIEGVSRNGIKG